MDPSLIHPKPELNHANVFVSEDQGKTLRFLGQSIIPEKDKTFQEHMIVEKKDGTLWMLGRTKYGVGEAFSKDQGRTWTEMAPAKGIAVPRHAPFSNDSSRATSSSSKTARRSTNPLSGPT